MDITDFNKGKKPINMNPQKSHNPPIFSPQPHSMKTTKSFTTQTQTQTTQIYSPQPFTPIYSPQPFAPYYPTTTTTTTKSTTFYSRPSSPLCSGSIPTSKKQYPQRSLNNSPLSIGSDNGSINISTNYPIHQSSSTSKLYLGNKKTHISNNVSNSMNMNNLYPPNFNNYGANINSGNGVKHQNKTVHKVYQHTRKVINDDNNESVEVSTEVTQQLYQIDGSLGHEHSSIYSFTSYTNNTNENNNNMKKKNSSRSTIDLQNYNSDNVSGSGSEPPSPKIKHHNQNHFHDIKNFHAIPNIESIPSYGSLENREINDEDIIITNANNNANTDKEYRYNIPLNDTVSSNTQKANYHKRYHSDHIKYPKENINYHNFNNTNIYNNNINDFSSVPNNININNNMNMNIKQNINTNQLNIPPVYHKNKDNDRPTNTYNDNNYNKYGENINIVIGTPDNSLFSTTGKHSEESSPEDVSSQRSNFSIYSSTTYHQKTSNIVGESNNIKHSNNNNNTNNINLKNVNNKNVNNNNNTMNAMNNNNIIINYNNEDPNYLYNKNQASNTLNSFIISQEFEQSSESQDSEINESQITYTTPKLNNRINRKKHKTTTTTTTTYEIIEDIDDEEEEDNDMIDNDENNNDKNNTVIEKYVRFSNLPYQYNRPVSFYQRSLLPPPPDMDVVNDKDSLSQQINLRKISWHTSFFENKGKIPSSSMLSIPRYQPDYHSTISKFDNDSYDSTIEDKTCYHILYQFDKEDFIVRLGKALYLYGSPTFRTECTLRSVSKLLGLQGEFASFPTLILLSFSKYSKNETLNSESHLLLTPTGYNLGKLEEIVQITHELKLALKGIKPIYVPKKKDPKEIKKQKEMEKEKKKKKKEMEMKQKKLKKKKLKDKNNYDDDDDDDDGDIKIEKSNSINDISHVTRKRKNKTKNTNKNNKDDEVIIEITDNNENGNRNENEIENENNDITESINNNNESENLTVYSNYNNGNININNSGDTLRNINNIINNNDNYNSDDNKFNGINDIDNDSDISFEKNEKLALTAAINKLDYVIAKSPSFGSVFWQIPSYIIAGATAAPILFGGSWLDVIVSAIASLVVGVITFYEPFLFPSHSHLVELLACLGASATIRIIQSIIPNYCVSFTADILSSVLYHLPGLNFTIGFIELASRNMISGTVRLIHSLVTSFMMGAGITIGVHSTKFVSVPIVSDNSYNCEAFSSPNSYWYFLMFPLLGISLNMMFFANASQFPIMILTTAISYMLTLIGTKLNFPSEITIIVSALAVGIVSNIYAKLRKRLAIIPIIIGILLLVPGSTGVKGSLAFLIDQNFETGVQFSINMFMVSMWITIGVFLSNLIVFPFKNSENMGLMTL